MPSYSASRTLTLGSTPRSFPLGVSLSLRDHSTGSAYALPRRLDRVRSIPRMALWAVRLREVPGPIYFGSGSTVDVLLSRYWFQVFRSYAQRVSAKVVQLLAFWDRPDPVFVGPAVRPDLHLTGAEDAVDVERFGVRPISPIGSPRICSNSGPHPASGSLGYLAEESSLVVAEDSESSTTERVAVFPPADVVDAFAVAGVAVGGAVAIANGASHGLDGTTWGVLYRAVV